MAEEKIKNKTSALHKALIFFILVLPAGMLLFFFFAAESHNFVTLPYLGPKEVVNGDTIYHTIPDFEFIGTDGKTFSSKQLEGKVYVAEFFQVESRMRLVVDDFKDESDVEFVSFSAHDGFENAKKMAIYAEIIYADTSRWHFLSGSKEEVLNIAVEGFFKGSEKASKIEAGIMSHNIYVLIDKQGHIRGVYDGGKKREAIISEINRVKDGIRLLKKQEDKAYAGKK